jgi:hypothetical protein
MQTEGEVVERWSERTEAMGSGSREQRGSEGCLAHIAKGRFKLKTRPSRGSQNSEGRELGG